MNLPIVLHRESGPSLQRQLSAQLRQLIAQQVLRPGQQLPSSRQLAKDFGLARNTVMNSYAQLISEGLLEPCVGSGTKISDRAPAPPETPSARAEKDNVPLSVFGTHIARARLPHHLPVDSKWNFLVGLGADLVSSQWKRLLSRHQRIDAQSSNASSDQHWTLRQFISAYLNRARRASASAEQTIVLHNMQQALDLIARMQINAGDTVVMEDPCCLQAKRVFDAFGATLLPTEMDDLGILVQKLQGTRATLAYVTPSHQFPSGARMSHRRRAELLHWASDCGALIIEDDRGFEYRYGGPVPDCIQGMNANQVIYVGDFNYAIPDMKLAYIVIPPSLVPAYRSALQISGVWLPSAETDALTEFIAEGYLERHIHGQKSVLNKRRIALIHQLRKQLGDSICISGELGAAHLVVKFNCPIDLCALVKDLQCHGVYLETVQSSGKDGREEALILGYGRLDEKDIEFGVKLIADSVAALKTPPLAYLLQGQSPSSTFVGQTACLPTSLSPTPSGY